MKIILLKDVQLCIIYSHSASLLANVALQIYIMMHEILFWHYIDELPEHYLSPDCLDRVFDCYIRVH